VVHPAHPNCFFDPKLSGLRARTEWSEEERLRCVKAFRTLGMDFAAVAESLRKAETAEGGGGRSAEEVEAFYHDMRIRYQLDYLIELHEREEQEPRASSFSTLPNPCITNLSNISSSSSSSSNPAKTSAPTRHHLPKLLKSSSSLTSSKLNYVNGQIRVLERTGTSVYEATSQQGMVDAGRGRGVGELRPVRREQQQLGPKQYSNNPREPVGCVWSSMVTRNQKAQSKLDVRRREGELGQ